MSTTTIIALIACGVVALLFVAGGAAFWFLRMREEEAPRKNHSGKEAAEVDDDEYDEYDEYDKYDDDADEEDEEAEVKPPLSQPEPTPEPAVAAGAAPRELDDFEATGDKILILVVDDNPDTRDNVSRLLYFEKDMEVMGHATNGREGIEQAIALRPHIVLMDINMPDVDGITATKEMSVKAPYSQVIIMSVQTESHYMRQAMSAGARDFQPKPFTAEELVSCIRRVYKIGQPVYRQIEAAERMQQSQQKSAKKSPEEEEQGSEGHSPIIAVYSPKGGIGTSTLAINLAVALQQEIGEIVLVDGDLQFGDISVHLNTKAKLTISNVIQEGQAEIDLVNQLALPHNSGLKLLLAPIQPEFADEITPDIIAGVIQELRDHFQAVVVDTNSYLNDKTLSILEAADYILLVATPELPGVKDAKLFLELASQLEIPQSRIGVVINRANLPGGVNPDQIEQALKLKHSFRIPYDPRMMRATRRGTAVVQQDPGAPSSQAVVQMSQEIAEKIGITVLV